MKKTLSIILTLILCIGLFTGCNKQAVNSDVIYPLPETLDLNSLDNCTVWVSLENGTIIKMNKVYMP